MIFISELLWVCCSDWHHKDFKILILFHCWVIQFEIYLEIDHARSPFTNLKHYHHMKILNRYNTAILSTFKVAAIMIDAYFIKERHVYFTIYFHSSFVVKSIPSIYIIVTFLLALVLFTRSKERSSKYVTEVKDNR